MEELLWTNCDKTCLGIGTFWGNNAIPLYYLGVGIPAIATTLAWSGPNALSESLYPMKETEGDLNWSFFSVSPRSWLRASQKIAVFVVINIFV